MGELKNAYIVREADESGTSSGSNCGGSRANRAQQQWLTRRLDR